jgi:hypothetical protein
MRVVQREPNWYASTFPAELVTLSDGRQNETLFCKHGSGYVDHEAGHRRGPSYESLVYRTISPHAPAPRFFGSFLGAHGTTVVLAFVRGASRLTETPDGPSSEVVRAASALGLWHARAATIPSRWCLNTYDHDHFTRWAHRAGLSVGKWLGEPVGERVFGAAVPLLASGEPTLIHGELVPANVLSVADQTVFVDWESAGHGPGEIDLAALTVGAWSDATRRTCIEAYVSARWTGGQSTGFADRMEAARLYVLSYVAHHLLRQGLQPRVGWLSRQLRDAVESTADLG